MSAISFAELRGFLAADHAPLVSALDRLAHALQARLAGAAGLRQASRGEIVVPDGGTSAQVGYVLDGTLGMAKTLPDGREHIIGLLLPSDMFGRIFDGPFNHRLEALSDCRLLCFERAPFEAVLREAPELERMFLVSLLDELDAAREWVLLLNGTRVTERVAAFLVILAHRQHRSAGSVTAGEVTVRLPMGRGDFARCLGVRSETLSRAIHGLAREGLIRILDTDRFEIGDLDALAEASGLDLAQPLRRAALRNAR